MTDLLSDIDAPSDAELISRVRGGDVAAYGELFSRHKDAANRLAKQLVRGPDSDDLVSEAFAKVLTVLQGGGGPDVAFRAYLLTAVRRLHVDRVRAGQRLQTTDDMTPFDPGVPFKDTAVAGFETGAAAKAFASLPERWQLVLWHLEVEGQKPADIAPLLGMSANSVSALAYRAREGLRQAFLTMHLSDISETECRWVNEHLGAFVRKGLSKRDATKVQTHLDGCRRCTAMYLELADVNSNLAGIIAPAAARRGRRRLPRECRRGHRRGRRGLDPVADQGLRGRELRRGGGGCHRDRSRGRGRRGGGGHPGRRRQQSRRGREPAGGRHLRAQQLRLPRRVLVAEPVDVRFAEHLGSYVDVVSEHLTLRHPQCHQQPVSGPGAAGCAARRDRRPLGPGQRDRPGDGSTGSPGGPATEEPTEEPTEQPTPPPAPGLDGAPVLDANLDEESGNGSVSIHVTNVGLGDEVEISMQSDHTTFGDPSASECNRDPGNDKAVTCLPLGGGAGRQALAANGDYTVKLPLVFHDLSVPDQITITVTVNGHQVGDAESAEVHAAVRPGHARASPHPEHTVDTAETSTATTSRRHHACPAG